jgi:hypothetical protein
MIMKIVSSRDSVERLKELTFNNMKNIEDGEPLNIFPLIDKSLASITIDKKSFKDLGLGSVAQSVLISDCVINNAKYTSDSFLIDPSSSKANFSTFDPAQRVQILEDHLKILKDVADYCDNNGGKKVEEAKIFLKESLAKVDEEISLLIDIIRVNEKHIPFDYNSTLKDNSRFTFKENGMITLGNSLEGETPKIKNSTFGDSFGDM